MAVWTPAEITTGLWLDAADGSTVTVSTGVSGWADKSGNSRNFAQSTASSQPEFVAAAQNGLSALRFNDTSHHLTSTVSMPQDAATTFIVRKLNGLPKSGDDKYLFCLFASPSAGIELQVRNRSWAHPHQLINNLNYNSEVTVGIAEPLDTAPRVFGWTYNNGPNSSTSSYTIHLDGSEQTVLESAGTIIRDRLVSFIGKAPEYNTYANMDLYELLVIPGVADSLTIAKVEGYLAHKWGLAANLPSSHPYKSEAPSLPSFSPAVHEISATGISKFALGNITSPVGAIVAEGETGFTPITGTGDVVQPRPEISGYGGVFRDGIALSPPKHEVSSRGTADIVSWGRSRQASRVSGQGYGNVLVCGWMEQSLPGISGAALVSAMGEGRVSGRQLVSSSGEINPNIAAGTMRFRQPAGSISAASMLLASCNGAFSAGRPSVRAAGESAVSCVGRVTSRGAGISAATAIATPSLVFSRDSRFAPTVSASSPVNIIRFERS